MFQQQPLNFDSLQHKKYILICEILWSNIKNNFSFSDDLRSFLGGQHPQQNILQAWNVHRKKSWIFSYCASSISASLYDGVSCQRRLMTDLSLMISNYRYQQIKYEIDPEYLFSPISGEGKLERRIVENYFKVNYTHRFNVGRITRPGEKLILLSCLRNRVFV